mmetsp:Transcript_69724/g.109066  ORF Transcript_69724/g.109066 Transcript_69724/m.109066 type:complete len:498 (-) Transcript_69724:103-1596(-)
MSKLPVLSLILWFQTKSHGVRVPLKSHEHRPHWYSFLSMGEMDRETRLDLFRARHNNTHAIEYYGEIQVGGQNLSVLFDTGSDQLLVPGADCVSPACDTHRHYDESKSRTVRNQTDEDPKEVAFGTGTAMGYDQEDQVCLGDSCARVDFIEVVKESDDPFAHAGFDGVLGLSLKLRRDATAKTSVLKALTESKAIPAEMFSVFLSKDLHQESSEISFGTYSEERMDGPLHWVPLSEVAYWQFSLASISVGGKKLAICSENSTQVGKSVSSFFGHMCCRSLEEFEHEQRCQFFSNYTETGNRSRYTDQGTILASYEDGRVAVQLKGGCVQKVPREWLSLSDGCRGDGTIQALLDTGSSLMMGPQNIVLSLLSAVGAQENCTTQIDKGFPSVSFTLPDGMELTLAPEDYMDQLVLGDGVYCWPHLIPMPETAKGAALVLGMPFLRAFYSVFDVAGARVGFAKAKQPQQSGSAKESQLSKLSTSHNLRSVALHSRRPEGA